MIKFIKKILPKPIRQILINIKIKTFDRYNKKRLADKMQIKHKRLVANLQGKEKIKVVFLVIHESVWKVDSVFERMQQDSYFEPEILICPYVRYGEERMQEDMTQAYTFFKNKGYPIIKSKKEDGTWIKLEEIKPDMVFFTNPYNLTRPEYYKDAYLNYLSCYVPYYFMATKHTGEEYTQYNNLIFLAAWRVYWPHDYCKVLHEKLSVNYGKNGLTLGFPATEALYLKQSLEISSKWKTQPSSIKKIIYAPHHTIDESKCALSSFLKFGEIMKEFAKANKGKVQWSFKPHPILRSNLYLHSDWGRKKTDAYYDFWKEQPYTQLDEGDYYDLFLSSDAIIHDCSSFIVEYAFTGKPCLYLVNYNNLKGLLNEFGEGVMQVYKQARSVKEINNFVDSVINNMAIVNKNKLVYFDNYVERYYKNKLPSERIIVDIKQSLGVLK
jgi:hypothetical protein